MTKKLEQSSLHIYMLIITREKPSNAYAHTQFSYGNINKCQSYSHDDKVKCNMHQTPKCKHIQNSSIHFLNTTGHL